jgi:Coenzyme PQQ synthesis protein D (PqqD)
MAGTGVARPSPSVKNLEVEGGLVLFDTSSSCLFAYNESARDIWNLLEGRQPEADIALTLAARFDLPAATVRKDVKAILRHWGEHGLVRASAPTSRSRRTKAKPKTRWTRTSPKFAGKLTCTIRDVGFEIAVEPPECIQWLQSFYRHLETPGARVQVRLQLRKAGKGTNALLVNGKERVRADDNGFVLGAVNQTILEHIHPGTDWLAMIHGGAIARNGSACVFPAASGSGKTTLIAYLIARGYSYLADDLIALTGPEGRLAAWPLPLSVKQGSWPLISKYYPNFADFPSYHTARGWARQIVPGPAAWNADPVPVTSIIFPRYVAGAKATLKSLDLFETLQRLISDRMWLGYPMTEARIRAFIAWLKQRPAYALVYSDITRARRLLDQIA